MSLFECAFRGTFVNGEVFSHSFWFESLGSIEDVATAAVTHWGTAVTGGLDSFFPTSLNWGSLHTSEVTVSTGVVVRSRDDALSVHGDQTSSVIPNQCATVVSLRTGVSGRANRGRSYLPGVGPGSLTTSGTIDGGTAAAIALGIADFFTDMGTDGHNPVVYSRSQRAAIAVTSVVVDEVVDTQRRRRDKLIGTAHTSAVPTP